MLFKPFKEIIDGFGVDCHQYADGRSSSVISLSRSPNDAIEITNQCLTVVVKWLRMNKMKQNPDKTKADAVLLVYFSSQSYSLMVQFTSLVLIPISFPHGRKPHLACFLCCVGFRSPGSFR